MLRRLTVVAAVLACVVPITVVGLSQTWPECLTGCTAKDVEVLGAYLTDATSGCDVHLLIQAKRQNTYCIVLACTVEYTDTGGIPGTASVVHAIDYLAGGIHDLSVANVDCLDGTGISVTDVYIAWSPNSQTCEQDCTDYGPGSKCNGTTPDLPAVTGGDLLVIKDATPDYPASFGFSSAALSPSAFTLIDDGSGGNTQEFHDVANGTYIIYENSLPSGWSLANISVIGTAAVTFGSGSNYTRTGFNASRGDDGVQIVIDEASDFAVITFENSIDAGTLTVIKYEDLNRNGIRDTSPSPEPALAGWTIEVYEGSGCAGGSTLVASGTTAADGTIGFELPVGTYYVTEQLPTGWINTQPGANPPCATVAIAEGAQSTVLLGNAEQPGSIGVHKYNDLNGNGSDDGEPSLGGWTITLHAASGCQDTPLASASTDASGNVTFSNLAPGTYYVGETLQPGWENTEPGTSPPCVEVTLSPGGSPAVDLGNRQLPGAITIQKATLSATTEAFSFAHDEIGGETSFDLGSGATKAFASVTPGTYVFTEQALGGWSIFDISKGSGDAAVRFGSSGSFHDSYQPGDTQVEVTVGANQSAAIVFTNEQSQQEQFGSITVSKDVVPDDGSTWIISAVGVDSPASQTLADGESCAFLQLTPGDYTVSESGPPGYDPFADAGADGNAAATSIVINIGPGDAKTVAFTNTLQGQQNSGGGGGGGGASSGCYNNNPVPNAGPDQVGCVGQHVCLDGSASRDPDEDLPENFPGSADVSPMYRHQPRETLRFGWTFAIHHYEDGRAVLDIPRGSRVLETVEGFDTEFPCFVPDLPGRYVLVLTVTDDYGASLMDQVTVVVEECDHSERQHFPTGWQLVSVPLQAAEASLEPMGGVRADEVAWQLFRYGGEYIAADRFTLGVGYWLYAAEPLALTITGLPVNGSFSIRLRGSGWHLIGTPFAAAWDQVRVEHENLTWSIGEAAARGLIEDLCVGTAADGSYTQVDLMLPWNGYWAFTHVADAILHLRELSTVPPTFFWTSPPASSMPPGPPQTTAGIAEVSVAPNPSRHQPVVFGVGGLVIVDELRVRVFDVAGHLIWSETTAARELTWDTIRNDGGEAARGAYIYLVEIRSGGTWAVVARDVLILAPAD